MDGGEPGGAVVSWVSPDPGHEVAFHRWYERDHFHAGCMAGPGFFAGRRFVSVPGDEPLGFLALYWIERGAIEEATRWSIERFHALRAEGRLFEAATLRLGGFFDVTAASVREPDGVPPALALDHPFAGVTLTALEATDVDATTGTPATGPVALSLELAPRPRVDGAARTGDPSEHPERRLRLAFSDETPAAGPGHAFRPTVPGTDRYVAGR